MNALKLLVEWILVTVQTKLTELMCANVTRCLAQAKREFTPAVKSQCVEVVGFSLANKYMQNKKQNNQIGCHVP